MSARGDFDPLVDEATFYGVQAVLDGRVLVSGRNHPDLPLRGFGRCETCGRPLTGSWSQGRNGRYAYYHCQRQCRAVNVSKTKLEGLFVDEGRAFPAVVWPSASPLILRQEILEHFSYRCSDAVAAVSDVVATFGWREEAEGSGDGALT